MIGAPNSLNLNCKVRVMKEAPGPSVSEEIADIFTNHNIDDDTQIQYDSFRHVYIMTCIHFYIQPFYTGYTLSDVNWYFSQI